MQAMLALNKEQDEQQPQTANAKAWSHRHFKHFK